MQDFDKRLAVYSHEISKRTKFFKLFEECIQNYSVNGTVTDTKVSKHAR